MKSSYHTESTYHAHLTEYSISEEDTTGQGIDIGHAELRAQIAEHGIKEPSKKTTVSKMKQQTFSDTDYGGCIAI